VREVPLMLGGAAQFQRENILAAIATAYVQGMRYDDIRAGLLSFFPSPSLTPGRLNLLRVPKGRVLVDYAHNAAAIRGLMEFVQNIDANRRIGVVSAPGDRRDEDLRAVGRLAACLDYVVVKEDDYRRGRPAGHIADLIIDGLRDAGMSENQYETIFSEQEAITRAMDKMKENDLVVILADNVSGSLDLVRQYSNGGMR
jgi:cyanophycin synthetase